MQEDEQWRAVEIEKAEKSLDNTRIELTNSMKAILIDKDPEAQAKVAAAR